MSGKDKWRASNNAYNENRAYNTNKALNTYGQDIADYINNYYDNNQDDLGYGKYYFRHDDRNKEYDKIINNLTDKNRNSLQQYLDNNFAGLGGSNTWLNNYWNGNEADDLINNFINTNYNDALTQIERAKNRGYLSAGGYNNAFNSLQNQMSAAKASVGDIGKGIIDDYKSDLTNKVQGYMTDLDNYNLNKRNSMSTTNWENDLANTYNDQKAGLENRFNLATNGLNLFDTSDLIGNARITQGVNNNQSDDLYNAIDEQQQKKSRRVGLGNKGLF